MDRPFSSVEPNTTMGLENPTIKMYAIRILIENNLLDFMV